VAEENVNEYVALTLLVHDAVLEFPPYDEVVNLVECAVNLFESTVLAYEAKALAFVGTTGLPTVSVASVNAAAVPF
jgi:hypothetical protein